jgi:hypothetical protein
MRAATFMPNVLPAQLTAFVDHVVPIMRKHGLARTEYAGTTVRDHIGLSRPARPGAVSAASAPGRPRMR